MKKQHIFSLAVAAFLVLVGAVMASSGRTDEAAIVSPAIGSAVEDFSLPGNDGSSHSLNSLKGTNGSVLIFISVQCPISNGYNERMEAMAQAYGKRGITVIGINANSGESADAVKAHAAEKHFTFTVLKDNGNKIADKLGAMRTPEAYLLDANNKLVYHGRIDNSKDESKVDSSDLRDAMDSLLAEKPIAKPTALAFGCNIKRA
jgi:peroxiredoxin